MRRTLTPGGSREAQSLSVSIRPAEVSLSTTSSMDQGTTKNRRYLEKKHLNVTRIKSFIKILRFVFFVTFQIFSSTHYDFLLVAFRLFSVHSRTNQTFTIKVPFYGPWTW